MTDSSASRSAHPFSLDGRTALVTGSSKGLGRALAFALGAAGAKVALNFKNGVDKAAHTFSEFRDAGHAGALFRADVIDPGEVERLCGEVAEQLGPIEILFVNATPDQPQRPIEEYDWDFYQSMLDFFVKSPYLLARQTLPHMKGQRWGRIINIGSEVFHRGIGNFSAYVAAKGAQNGWTRSMATELAPHGVTCNILSPGWIPVERHENDPQELKDGYRELIPMDRWGVPEDLGGAAVFLSSEASSFITGQDICVNGGMTVG